MRRLILVVALFAAGCGGSSSTSPTPPVVVPPPVVTPPPVVAKIEISACTVTTAPAGIDPAFYRALACNGFEAPSALQPLRRWTVAPMIYIKTVDEAGAPIDAVTLDTVQQAMIQAAPLWTGGKFSISATRGTETRENVSGWVTVKWPATIPTSCGNSHVAIDGGSIDLSYKNTNCGCNGSAMRPRTAAHELGHTFGYWHTDSTADLMSGAPVAGCSQQPSARELAAAAAHYR